MTQEKTFNIAKVKVYREEVDASLLEGEIDYTDLFDRDQILKGKDKVEFEVVDENIAATLRFIYENFGILKSELVRFTKIVQMRRGRDPDKVKVEYGYTSTKGLENKANTELKLAFRDIRRKYPQPEEVIEALEKWENGDV